MPSSAEPRTPGTFAVVLAFAAVYLIWGSTYLAIRFAVESMPPFLMAGARHLVPGLVLVAWAGRRRPPRPTPRQIRDTAVVGLLLLLGGNGLVTWAEQWVPSGLTALLVASVPLWMGLMSGLVEPASRPRARGIAGLVLGFAGVGLLVEPRGELAADARTLAGALGVLAAAFLWAAGSLWSRRADLPRDPLLATGIEMLAGSAGLALVGTALGEWPRVDPGAVTTRSALSLLYLATFGSIVGFSAYVWLLQVAAPAKVATYAYVNPVVAVVLGVTLGGEALGARTVAAAAVIVAAVVMITSERTRRPPPASSGPPASPAASR
jgi:drug/metabolite transporter (DMT)-like permease